MTRHLLARLDSLQGRRATRQTSLRDQITAKVKHGRHPTIHAVIMVSEEDDLWSFKRSPITKLCE
ncbi:hypothetical protein Nocox_39650 [Nonomuraea coxensis DSM 45129]|uniref:Transposase n=1 Tax=Nonomuraea coxensis DSM 45129 TaxID=1122611 RepID=A0ABX8UCH3_9ACTN|nr:hypothetical protein Nocox_39650 [Nonomuraea coxensis DSM 45129]